MPDIPEIVVYDMIYSDIGVGPERFRNELKALGDVPEFRVRINSPGGSVFDGVAIHSLLKSHKGKKIVTIDGVAASIASVIAMAGDEIEMAQGAFLMIHDPVWCQYGNAEDMRDMAELLDKVKSQIAGIYAARTKLPADKIDALISAETWMTAAEAVALGFADRAVESPAIAASFGESPLAKCLPMFDRFKNVPELFLSNFKQGVPTMAKETANESANEPKPATCAELKAAIPKADAAFLVAQLEANATLAQAQTAWTGELDKRLEAANKEIADLKAAGTPLPKKPGVQTIGNGSELKQDGSIVDPIAAWNAAIEAKVKAGSSRQNAVKAVVRENPDLHDAYLKAVADR